MRKELARTAQPHVIHALDTHKRYPSVRVFDEVLFEESTGKLCTELEASKMLQADSLTSQVQHDWVPLLQVVHQGVLSIFGHLNKFLPPPEPHTLLKTPTEGNTVRGRSRVISNMLQLQKQPDRTVKLYYFTSTSYAERLADVLYMGDTLEPHSVEIEGAAWTCLVEGMIPLVQELVRIAHSIGE